MAHRWMLNDSIIVEDYFNSPTKQEQNNIVATSTPCRAANLTKLAEELFWEGFLECLKVRSHGATSRRDMLRGHVVRSESHEVTKLGENKSHKRLYALGHTKRHFHATGRCIK